jgi:hypothetical protein
MQLTGRDEPQGMRAAPQRYALRLMHAVIYCGPQPIGVFAGQRGASGA